MLTNFTQKNSSKFECITCDFNCSNKNDYNRHILTRKHKILTNVDTENFETVSKFECECGKEYNHRQSLSIHKKKCNYETNNQVINNTDYDIKILTNMVLEVVKQNKELMVQNTETQKQNKELTNKLFEICKNGTHNSNSHNTTNNSHNKSFNLQFFLNETCKDAMNIMDFVDSIKLQLSDLENVGKLGYVEGISNIIVKNLNDLDVTERPIHCTDKKREVIYVKDDNKWEKEDEEKKKIKKVIKHVANKNIRLIKNFKEAHPDCGKSNSKFSDQYDKIIVESMGGSGNNDFEKEEKIIQKISKNITIDKDIIM